jgi:TolB-like protein/Tfp pilus assembly protein PilF
VPAAPKGARWATSRLRWLAAIAALAVIAIGAAWWLRPSNPPRDTSVATSSAPGAAVSVGKPSIAVLPFDNMSGEADKAYFADGITEDLITDLSKVAGLVVIARNSTFQYKGKAHDVRDIGKALNVRYVLEGSVRRSGESVRVNAQLIDAATGAHVWADRYDGEMKDIFGVQDTVTRNVVKALSVELTGDESKRVAMRGTENAGAYDAFLRGWDRYLKQTPEDFRAAIVEFKKAAEIDPNYGRAYAALAAIYWESYTRFWAEAIGAGARNDDALSLADQYLAKAMRAPTPLADQVASAMALHSQRHDDAISEARRAIVNDPNDANGYIALANVLSFDGKPAEALEAVDRATRLNPHYPSSYLYQRGLAQFGANRLTEAASSLEGAIAMNPDEYWSQRLLLATYGLLGRRNDATKLAATMRAGDKRGQNAFRDPLSVHGVTYWFPFSKPEDAKRFADGLAKAGIPE